MGRASIPIVVLALLVAGCGDDAMFADAAVAVRVNESDIPVPQVRAVLRHQPQWLAAQPDTATARVVEVLVDQELAAQAATDRGLDRDEEVLQALALARREVLARAYQERIAATARDPGRDEIDRYRGAHPLLFGQRRIYLLQEFTVDATPVQAAVLTTISRRARGTDDVASLLREAGLPYRTRRFAAAAEDVPAAWLEPLAVLERGQSLALMEPREASAPRIVTVLDVHAAPLERQQADEAIAAHLSAEHQRRLVVPAMRALRDAAQIRYRGAFVKAPVVAPVMAPRAVPVTPIAAAPFAG